MPTIHMAENPVHLERTKHLDIDFHFIWDHYSKGFLKPIHARSKNQIIDMFTKPLPTT